MMNVSKGEELIVKFLTKEANQLELDQLDDWLKDPKNSVFFNEFVQTEHVINLCMKTYSVENAKIAIDKKVRKQKTRQRSLLFSKIAVAAILAFLLGASILSTQSNKNKIEIVNQPLKIESGVNKAILTLENGNEIALEKGKDYSLGNIVSNGEELVYTRPETKNKEEVLNYNYLTIPKGGQFYVSLSDGTKVWLNSDSKIKYPAVFPTNETREIELIYGEAYLEVSPSSKHNGNSFSVFSEGQEINVLGTHFNIRAYLDDEEIATTLVEGKVLVKKGDFEKILTSNQQSIVRENEKGIEIIAIDASTEISWVKGLFTFNEESLAEIMKIVSRWYDIEVVFESAEQKNYVFTGVLERTGSFVDIINLIEATSENEVIFEVNGKTVTIK